MFLVEDLLFTVEPILKSILTMVHSDILRRCLENGLKIQKNCVTTGIIQSASEAKKVILQVNILVKGFGLRMSLKE